MENDIFSRLQRLGDLRNNKGQCREQCKKVIFLINIPTDGGDATISTVDTKMRTIDADPDCLSLADGTLVRAIASVRDREKSQSLWSGLTTDGGVSLSANPFLCFQLANVTEIIDNNGQSITMAENTGKLYLDITVDTDAGTGTVKPVFVSDGEVTDDIRFLTDSCLVSANKIYFINPLDDIYKELHMFDTTVPLDSLGTLLSIFLTYTDSIPLRCEQMRIRNQNTPVKMVPTLILEKVDADKALYMSVTSTAEDIDPEVARNFHLRRFVTVRPEDNAIMTSDIEDIYISDEIKYVEESLEHSAPSRELRRAIYRDGNFFIVPEDVAGPFLLKYLPDILRRFRVLGTDKLRDYKVKAAFPKLNVRLSSGIDFLEGEADVEIGDRHMSLAQLIAEFNKNRYVTLADGSRGVIDDNYMRRLERIFRKRDKDGNIKVSFFDLPEIEQIISDGGAGQAFEHSRKVYRGFNDLKDKKLPSINIKATLRNYQKEGIKWLLYLHEQNLGGCLADDMGLGKTVQTIALLSRVTAESKLPSLVIVPKSLVFNWQNEFRKFAPELDTAVYYGLNRDLEEALKHKVVVTTYAMVRNDIEKLRDKEYEYIILDESQTIKNVNAQMTKAVFLLKARHRLALSGTPLENNLTELYSLFRFLNPAMFGSLEDFNNFYTYPIQRQGDRHAMESLRRKIFPFILRRLKKDVLQDLPDRVEQTVEIEMSEAQKNLYERKRVAYRNQIRESISSQGVAASQFVMFQALTELRQIASVPETQDPRINSPKVETLMEQLTGAVGNGHKTVVFFNFLAGIDLVSEQLTKLGIDHEVMTGATRDRKRIVERFQNDPKCMVLLLTLKVGGVGLNLTEADTVFIFEPWWNVAAEEQAINRLHRIGQKNTVYSYKLITLGTIEEKILELQQQKKELFDGLIGADSAFTKQLSEEDINFILS